MGMKFVQYKIDDICKIAFYGYTMALIYSITYYFQCNYIIIFYFFNTVLFAIFQILSIYLELYVVDPKLFNYFCTISSIRFRFISQLSNTLAFLTEITKLLHVMLYLNI